jgi:CheY-like chemotaxis protein
MGQNSDLVVLTSLGEGIIVKGLQRKMQAAGINMVYSHPRVNELSAFADQAAIYVVYISGDVDNLMDILIYLKDFIKEQEKDLVIICEKTEKDSLEKGIPGLNVSRWFIRPIDSEKFSEEIIHLLEISENRKTIKNILVVDDDPSFAMMIRGWLKEDYQVFMVNSGMQAISFLMKNKVDLILLDYEMPITSGPQVLKMLRSEPATSDIPIMFLTGVSDAESVRQVISLKPDGYMLKSTSKADLLKNLKLFFGKRS